MKNKTCKLCGHILKRDMIDYKTKIWGKEIVIPFVEGYKCSECGYVEVDEKVKERLEVKILEKKLEMYKDGEVKILLINDIRNVRNQKGVPQGKIGEALDFTEQRFGAIERNDNTPTVYLGGVIAELLGVDFYDLYQFKVIPMEVFLELENLDENFNVIKNLPETRKEYYKTLDLERNLREEVNELKVKRRRIEKKIDNRKKKLNETLDKEEKVTLEEEIIELNKEIEALDEQIKYYDGEEVDVVLERAKRKLKETTDKKEIEKLNDEIKELEKIKRKNRNKKKPKKVGGKLEEVQKKLSELLGTIRNLEKKGDAILKQGYCLTRDHWEQAKEYFGDRLK